MAQNLLDRGQLAQAKKVFLRCRDLYHGLIAEGMGADVTTLSGSSTGTSGSTSGSGGKALTLTLTLTITLTKLARNLLFCAYALARIAAKQPVADTSPTPTPTSILGPASTPAPATSQWQGEIDRARALLVQLGSAEDSPVPHTGTCQKATAGAVEIRRQKATAGSVEVHGGGGLSTGAGGGAGGGGGVGVGPWHEAVEVVLRARQAARDCALQLSRRKVRGDGSRARGVGAAGSAGGAGAAVGAEGGEGGEGGEVFAATKSALRCQAVSVRQVFEGQGLEEGLRLGEGGGMNTLRRVALDFAASLESGCPLLLGGREAGSASGEGMGAGVEISCVDADTVDTEGACVRRVFAACDRLRDALRGMGIGTSD